MKTKITDRRRTVKVPARYVTAVERTERTFTKAKEILTQLGHKIVLAEKAPSDFEILEDVLYFYVKAKSGKVSMGQTHAILENKLARKGHTFRSEHYASGDMGVPKGQTLICIDLY